MVKGDPVELTPRIVVVAVLYAAAKTFILYVFARSVTESAREDLPRFADAVVVITMVLVVAAFVWWVLRPFYVLVRHRRDLG